MTQNNRASDDSSARKFVVQKLKLKAQLGEFDITNKQKYKSKMSKIISVDEKVNSERR